jgi:hypothetical protein
MSSLAKSLQQLADQITNDPRQRLLDLADRGWQAFYAEMFGQDFVDAMDSAETDDTHHSDAVSWHWEARNAILQGQRPPNDWFVYFPTWARGNMKTTVARAMLITDALLTYAHGQRGYALIPGGTKNKVKTHSASIEGMLHSPKVLEYCPALSRVKQTALGRSRGWTASYFETDAGYVFHFVGLEEGMAGANLEGVRPSFIVPDDIDNRNDSPVEAETKYRVFTSEVLPSRQAGTLVFWAQNIISRLSVRYRIEKQHALVLTNRKPTVAVPAVRGLITERQTMPSGIIKNVVLAGKPTWRAWNLERVQDEIDTYGLEAFLREMQHEVEQSIEGLLMKNWNDQVHVISVSEFQSIYGTRSMPPSWPKEWVNDWARTKTARHANVAFWRTVSAQNTPLPGVTFIFHPMSFEANAQVEDVAERLLTALQPTVDVGRDRQMTWNELRVEELIRSDALSHTRTQLARLEYERDALVELLPKYTEPVLTKHRVVGGVNSHEREDIRDIFNRVYAMQCAGVNPGKFGGIEQLNRDMMVDIGTPHPFRPEQMGYTRFFLVVPDDTSAEQEALRREGPYGTVYPPPRFTDATAPEQLHDHELFRYQMVNWRTVPAVVTVNGEIVDVPEKSNDDFGNALQMCAVNGPLRNVPLSAREEYEELIPEHIKRLAEDGGPMTKAKQYQIEMARFLANAQMVEKYGDDYEEELREEREEWEDPSEWAGSWYQ